jgi:hypothetical protein
MGNHRFQHDALHVVLGALSVRGLGEVWRLYPCPGRDLHLRAGALEGRQWGDACGLFSQVVAAANRHGSGLVTVSILPPGGGKISAAQPVVRRSTDVRITLHRSGQRPLLAEFHVCGGSASEPGSAASIMKPGGELAKVRMRRLRGFATAELSAASKGARLKALYQILIPTRSS